MRQYGIVSRILFILAITNFALAVPVSVQEKHQPGVDMVHIPTAVTAVLGKRAGGSDEEIEKALKKYFETWEDPAKSPDAHTSPRPYGSANVAQAPTANPDSLVEPPGLSSTTSMQVSGNEVSSHKGDDAALEPPALTWHGSDHESTGADAPQPNTNKRPTGPDPNLDFDWKYWDELVNPPRKKPKLSEYVQKPKQGLIDWSYLKYNNPTSLGLGPPKMSDQAQEHDEVKHIQQLSPTLSTNSEFDGLDLAELLPPSLVSAEDSDQAHEIQVGNVQQPSLVEPLTDSKF